jgi:hypothetical protein
MSRGVGLLEREEDRVPRGRTRVILHEVTKLSNARIRIDHVQSSSIAAYNHFIIHFITLTGGTPWFLYSRKNHFLLPSAVPVAFITASYA